MDLGISGRVAMVAAASKGIGLAVATALAKEGCRVSICSRDAAALEAARQKIAGGGAGRRGARLPVRRDERGGARSLAPVRHRGTGAGGHPGDEHGRTAGGAPSWI